jgi:hypothetical protein
MNGTIRIDRLEKCYAALASVREPQFDFGTFGYLMSEADNDCGTTACAIGWYIQKNPDCGMILYESASGYCDIASKRTGLPYNHSVKSLAQHFSISNGEARSLFFSDGCKNHDSYSGTLARLRAFIDKHKSNGIALDFKPESQPPARAVVRHAGTGAAVPNIDGLSLYSPSPCGE